jgi:hypothetical protein
MLPTVSLGFGGRLHIFDGAKVTNANLTFVSDSSFNDPIGPWRSNLGAGNNWVQLLFGGESSIFPGGFGNHKPCVFYFGDLYSTINFISEDPDVYIVKFDGSGIHKHGGDSGYASAWRNGRGTELQSPSGGQSIAFQSCSHLIHNSNLFILGASPRLTFPIASWANMDWQGPTQVNGADQTDRRRRRRYGGFAISKKEKQGKDFKLVMQATEFSPAALTQEDTQACDAISYSNDIFFTSHCDLVRYPGGSGIPHLVEETINIPSAKCLEIYPSGGFNANGDPVLDRLTQKPDLLMLTSSGVLKSVIFPSGIGSVPSGTTTLFDLGSLVTDINGAKQIRIGNQLQRVSSVTLEPTRSCYLKSFNNKLNAFISSPASGYYHFQCDGDPRVTDNWSNLSQQMPDDFRRFDGDMYAYHDTFRNALFVMHVSKSEVGIWGTAGAQNGAGGVLIAELNTDNNWRQIYTGMSAEPSIGLIPYNNLGVYAQAPSGNNPQIIPSTDYALLEYKLYSPFPRTVNVDIEYTIDKGVTWQSARRFKTYDTKTLLGDSKENLSASFFGDLHTFYWDYIKDIGFNNVQEAKLRIRVKEVR